MDHPWSAEQWLIAVLRGDAGGVWPGDPRQWHSALMAAKAQGVVALAYDRIWGRAALGSPPPPDAGWAAEARTQTAVSLALQAQCRAISDALAAAGIEHLWLKGMALGQWLYASPALRGVGDMDLLLRTHADALRVARVLAPLGYRLPNPHRAGDLVVHELLATSATGLELDLHWALGNSPLYAYRLAWDELWAQSQPLPGLGASARGLGADHALLHAAMHRAMNELVGSGQRLRWLYDIHLLAMRCHTDDWERIVSLAAGRGLAGTLLAALQATRMHLDTPVPGSVLADLQAAAVHEPLQCTRLAHWWYRQWAEWRALPSLAQRLRWARQLLMPDLAHLRVRYGGDGAGVARVCTRRLLDGARRLRRYTVG